MNKVKNKNKKKIIILVTIIFLVILIILLINTLKLLKQEKYKPDPVNADGWILYKNAFSDAYCGNYSSLEINRKIENVFGIYLPLLSSEFEDLKTDEELKQYYLDNEEYIKAHMYLYDSSEFIKLIKFYRENNIKFDEMGCIEYSETSYLKETDYEKVVFNMYYSNNKSLTFEIRVFGENTGYHLELLMK